MKILIGKVLNKIKFIMGSYIYPIFFIFSKVNNRKVIFSSFFGKQYSDSPKEISEYLYNTNPEYEIIWLLNEKDIKKLDIPNYIKVAPYNSIRGAYELSTSKLWVDNCRKSMTYFKKKHQVYIQTWHGTPLKKIEKDAGNRLPEKYHRNSRKDSINIDLLISGNRHTTKSLRSSFWYDGLILEQGIPRNDIFFSENLRCMENIRKEYNLGEKKLVLYAPTFRNSYERNGLVQLKELEPLKILEKLNKKYGSEFVLLYRFHSNVSKTIDRKKIDNIYQKNLIDVSDYPNMQELLYISDILITDYSSSFFDYSLLKRPIFLFMYDYEEYIDERGLYLKLDELPFYIAKTHTQLISEIDRMKLDEARDMSEKFLKQIGNVEDGKASERVVKYILDKTS